MVESLRERKRLRTAEELVDAALELFERQGYEATTVAEICAAAEQSRSTFFRYFGSKEDVLFHDVQADLEKVTAELAERLAQGASAWESATDASIGMLESAHLNGERARKRMALWQSEPALRARWAEHSSLWELAIAQVVARSRGIDAAEDSYAQAVAVATIGAARIAITTGHRVGNDFVGHVRRTLAVFEQGIAVAPSPRLKARRA